MAHAEGTRQWLADGGFFQVGHFAPLFVDGKPATLYQRHPGTVVATVFQSLQPFYQYRIGLPESYITHDATHKKPMCCLRRNLPADPLFLNYFINLIPQTFAPQDVEELYF
jgi:hypothetical protein